jgi:PQQ-dependent dehydrogenase (methanol/ethanol family)
MRRPLFLSLTACLALLVAAGLAGSLAQATPAASTAITPSPIYTAAQLGAPAGDDWLMHMGNLKGHRYSSLTQITKANVASLKLAWRVDLGYCTTNNAACGSFEANSVVANGVQYTQDPFGAVYALDGATGALLWKWTPTYETAPRCQPTGSCEPGFSTGSGSRKPGVAIGEGKVFAGLADGKLYGLDQTNGHILWVTEVTPWRTGGKTSSAPIYVNGMVLIGDSAGDNGGSSATMQAFTANNGKRIWSWGVIPTVGQPGYKTWSANSAGYTNNSTNGGGSLWESPIIDPKLNLAIFGTGNPVPWNSRGPGMNLYTDSIVALNLYTGQLVWYYQTTHHDLWDADLPNNGVMFTAKYKIKGKMVSRPGVAYVNKYGMTFILDRQTGKPLLPIPEVAVPQSTALDVNTWKTQPIPLADNVLGNRLDKDRRPCTDGNRTQTNTYVPFATAIAPDGKPYKIGCVYDPYDTTQYVVQPFEMMDWPASSYSPENQTFITCGVTDRATSFEQIPAASQVKGAFGGIGAGRLGVGDTSTSNRGNFASLNVTTGKLAWKQIWDAPCYSGSMNTKSGLTFIGHLGEGNAQNGRGYLAAVDTKTGAELWKSGLMDAPAAAAPVTYTAGGKQYVSIAVGGQSHNDVSRPLGLTNPARLRGDYIYTYVLP